MNTLLLSALLLQADPLRPINDDPLERRVAKLTARLAAIEATIAELEQVVKDNGGVAEKIKDLQDRAEDLAEKAEEQLESTEEALDDLLERLEQAGEGLGQRKNSDSIDEWIDKIEQIETDDQEILGLIGRVLESASLLTELEAQLEAALEAIKSARVANKANDAADKLKDKAGDIKDKLESVASDLDRAVQHNQALLDTVLTLHEAAKTECEEAHDRLQAATERYEQLREAWALIPHGTAEWERIHDALRDLRGEITALAREVRRVCTEEARLAQSLKRIRYEIAD